MDIQIRAGVLTISDKGAEGSRKDESGNIVAKMLEAQGYAVPQREIIPDDHRTIADTLSDWVDRNGLSLIVTSGGTGLSPTDVTPQATKEVIDYEVPAWPRLCALPASKRRPMP